MGDPHLRRFPVYLPPGYKSSRSEPYPVAFILAGWGGRACKYIEEGEVFTTPLHHRLDEAISKKEMPALIVVFPDGASKLGCSQYVNSEAIGNYSDYICDELVDFIDSKFNTHRDAGHRMILGHSSGGFGALYNAFHRPDRFQLACSSAGDSAFEWSLKPFGVAALNEINKAGSEEKFIKEFFESKNPGSSSRKKIDALLTLNLAACYAPNPKKRGYFGDLFFDLKTGIMLPEVWAKYLAFDPAVFSQKLSKNISKLKFVQLECGVDDEFGAVFGHRQVAQNLKAQKIPHHVVEYPGGHGGHNWRYTERLRLLLTKMSN